MSDNEGPMLGMFAGSGATWHISALRVGELRAENGPDGYYEMTAEAWCTWSCAQARLRSAENERLRKALEAIAPMFDNDSPLLKVYAKEIEQARNAIGVVT